jgi:hypothetical protein
MTFTDGNKKKQKMSIFKLVLDLLDDHVLNLTKQSYA